MMRTKFLLTVTNPDDLDPEDFQDTLEVCTPLKCKHEHQAREALADMARRTNMTVHLLRVEMVASQRGKL